MKSIITILLITFCFSSTEWKSKKENSFVVNYTSEDEATFEKYSDWVKEGQTITEKFFGQKLSKEFLVFIHPARQSLDEQWQKDLKMPAFKSECWMVASGDAAKLDMLSPRVWATQSCEHKENDLQASKKLITHEMVHVFHGQQNIDYNNTDGIDWLVEGVATYASGQLTDDKIKEIQRALAENKIKLDLSTFWTGKMRYGLSGSMIMYIDKALGREKLKTILSLSTKTEVLRTLGVTEEKLLNDWKKFIGDLKI
jgi:hypothetical protein